jgi:hypothetical protein
MKHHACLLSLERSGEVSGSICGGNELSYEEGGIKDLKRIATDGLDVFHVRFLRPDERSLGSHVPTVSANIRGMYPR